MPFVKALNNYLEWLSTEAYQVGEEGLAIYRIVYALFILFYGVPGFVWVGQNPDVFFWPPRASLPGLFFEGFPSTVVLALLSGGVCLSLLFILIGRYTRTASVLFSVLTVVGLSFSFSFGKIDHNLIVWVVPFFMAWSGWGRRFSLDARSPASPPVRGIPVAIVALLIGFCMFTAGAQKVWGGWLNPGTHAAYGHVYQAVEVFGRTPPLASAILGIDSSLILESFDYLVVAFEVGFLVAVLHPLALRGFLAGAFLFHAGVYLTMGIRTEILTIVYLLVLVDWDVSVNLLRRYVDAVSTPWYISRTVLISASFVITGLHLWKQFQMGLPESKGLSLVELIQFFG
jgi:hypothetical protein